MDDEYIAYCLDQAIGHIGLTIEGDLNDVEDDNADRAKMKRKAILERYLGFTQPQQGQYADPALFFSN